MSVLDACQKAIIRLVGRKPAAVFSSSDQLEVEVAELANETAAAMAQVHEWRVLTKLHTITGTGAATAFDMPSDYDRMPVKADVHSSRWELCRFTPAKDVDQWLDFQTSLTLGSPGAWIVLGGQMQIFPAMASNEEAKFYYQSNLLSRDNAGTVKAAFTADSDVFRLNERVLTLGIVWRWRAQKRMEYAEDLRNYEIALSEAIASDKGSRTLLVGRRRVPFDAAFAWPGTIIP